MPRIIGQFHLHQHIAGEEFVLGVDLLATAGFNNLLGGYQNLIDLLGQSLLGGLFLDLLGNLLLEARVDVHHVPLLGHSLTFLQIPAPNRARTPMPTI